MGLPCSSYCKESACNAGDLVWSLGREDPLEKGRQPTPVFLPGKSHGQRSLGGCSPWGRKESDTTKQLTLLLRIVDLQCCVSFWCTAKWFRHIYEYIEIDIHIYILSHILFHYTMCKVGEKPNVIYVCCFLKGSRLETLAPWGSCVFNSWWKDYFIGWRPNRVPSVCKWGRILWEERSFCKDDQTNTQCKQYSLLSTLEITCGSLVREHLEKFCYFISSWRAGLCLTHHHFHSSQWCLEHSGHSGKFVEWMNVLLNAFHRYHTLCM